MRYLAILASIALLACSEGRLKQRPDSASRPDPASAGGDSTCYRSARSVLGRTTPFRGRASTAPGWIRLHAGDRVAGGTATLTDADGATMTATWARREGDTLTIVAFDDFLRVTMDVVQSDTTLSGIAVASSDADVVRDSAGRIRDYRHDWTITARKAACEDILRENPASILPTFD